MNIYLNHFWLIFKKLGIAFLVFSLCRIFFYAFNYQHFNNVSISDFFYGLRFDWVAISYLFSPLIILQLIPFPIRQYKWYSITLDVLFYLANTVAIILNLIDVAYFDFTLKRTTADFFSMIGTGNDFIKLLPNYIFDFWYDYLLLFGLLFLSRLLYRKYCRKYAVHNLYQIKNYVIHSFIFIVFVGFTVLGMRGGIQYKPIDIVNAGQYTTAQNAPIVLNTPFTIIKTILIESIEPINFFEEEELSLIYSPEKYLTASDSSFHIDSFTGKNVVLIILESFSKEYVGGLNNGKGYTPFIDSLMKESYVFSNAYANGLRSIEALPCILTGIPQLMSSPYVLSNYAGNQLDGIPKILKEEGYNTSFYHGGANGTMGFNGFVGTIGIKDYYGMNEYPEKEKDYDGKWGIFDEPYLQYYAHELNNKKEPFFSTVFTLSSHHPYQIPKQFDDKFPKGSLPIHETIGYTDFAMKEFFETAKKMPWFKNTIFLFTADHSSISNDATYNTKHGRYAIPSFIYAPNTNLKGVNNNYFQHIDIFPTLMSLMGINKKLITFGNNAFNKQADKMVINYINNSYLIAIDNYFLIFDGKQTTEFYNLETDSLMTKNLINSLSNEQKNDKIKFEKLLKAIIQQYNNRLITNNLSISN